MANMQVLMHMKFMMEFTDSCSAAFMWIPTAPVSNLMRSETILQFKTNFFADDDPNDSGLLSPKVQDNMSEDEESSENA